MLKLLPLFLISFAGFGADTMPPAADQRLAHEIYKEMIESKSGYTTGSTTPIAESIAARLKAAGFPTSDIFLGGAIPRKANVIVRYHGSGARKPILLLAHIDVLKPNGRIGPPIHSSWSKRTAIFTDVGRWTTRRRRPCGSPT